MKKFIIIILIGFNLLLIHGQNVKFGFLVSPEIKYRTITKAPFPEFRNFENPGFGYSIGCFGIKNLTERKELEFGLHYTNKGYRTAFFGVFGDQIDPIQGVIGEPTEIIITDNYNFLCLPLKLNLLLSEKSYFTIGCQAEILIDANSKVKEGNEKRKNKAENIKPFNSSVSLGYGKVFYFNQFDLRLEPSFNFNIVNLYKSSLISEHLFNIGLNTKWVLN
jgi:hypothetical protein